MRLVHSMFKKKENYIYRLYDKDGNVKKLFQPNKLGQFLIKKGVVSPKADKRLLALLGLGRYSTEMRIANLVTNAGKAGVASRINGAGGEALFNYIAIGTGTIAPSATDTALGAEITTGGGARAIATVSRVTTSVSNDTARAEVTFNFTQPFAITESGLFNAPTGGTMLSRDTFPAINVNSGDSLVMIIEIQVQ